MKNAVLKNFTMFIRKQLSWSLFLINLKAFKLATLLQRNSTTGVSFKYSEIYKSVCFKDTHKHSLETWNFIKKEALAQVFPCEFSQISQNTLYHITHLVAASIIKENTDVFREDNQKRIQNPVKHQRWNFFQK